VFAFVEGLTLVESLLDRHKKFVDKSDLCTRVGLRALGFRCRD
jgi:hypothetical protein